jgi:hypothetical protein
MTVSETSNSSVCRIAGSTHWCQLVIPTCWIWEPIWETLIILCVLSYWALFMLHAPMHVKIESSCLSLQYVSSTHSAVTRLSLFSSYIVLATRSRISTCVTAFRSRLSKVHVLNNMLLWNNKNCSLSTHTLFLWIMRVSTCTTRHALT